MQTAVILTQIVVSLMFALSSVYLYVYTHKYVLVDVNTFMCTPSFYHISTFCQMSTSTCLLIGIYWLHLAQYLFMLLSTFTHSFYCVISFSFLMISFCMISFHNLIHPVSCCFLFTDKCIHSSDTLDIMSHHVISSHDNNSIRCHSTLGRGFQMS